jgi:7,8-dihydroneopterin aldolase/epimerase/oxygenase
MMSDKILFKNMMFYGFHGVYTYEQEIGQRFFIDVEYEIDSRPAGKSDDIYDTVDYTAVYQQIKEIAEHKRFQLLEALAENIAMAILECSSIKAVTVRVRKPAVPLPGHIDFIQIEIRRER